LALPIPAKVTEMMKRVLVVDDNEVIRMIVRSALEMQTPFVIHEAVDGFDALEKVETFNPDLVVMDLSMPGINGLDASRTLKKSHPPTQVVLFTSHKDVLSDSDAHKAGVSAVVSKTDGLETLLHQVEDLLQPMH
jgi:NarL family two-component system response regulator LiaR